MFETDSRLRQESFFIEERSADNSIVLSSPGASSSANPVRYFREELAKRLVNIRNIKHTGSSPTTIGNYEHNYQVVQATGRDVNNLWFRSGSTGEGGVDIVSVETAASGVLDFALPDRSSISHTTGSEPGTDRNRTVIAERFSAPGGPEVLSRGYLDAESETYSVYNSMNYRNSIVRDSLNYFSQISQTKFGAVDGSSVSSLHYELGGLGTSSYHGVPGNAISRATIVEPISMWNTCSFSFDGTNDYVGYHAINGMESMKYTWSIWFKPDSSGGGEDFLIDQGATIVYLTYDFSANKIKFYHAGSTGGAWSSPNNKITEDEWNHVAIALDATDITNDPVIYINGESVTVTEDTTPTSYTAVGVQLYFGTKASTASNWYKGLIDDAAFFNRVLDDHELKMLYNPTYAHTEGNPGPFNLEQHPAAPHMIAWYTFGDGPNDSASIVENMVLLNRCDHMQSGSFGTHPRNLGVGGAAASSDCLTVRYNEISLEEERDNHFVRNIIPRSDKQYSWITASLVQHIQHGTKVDLDHQKNNQFERFDKQSRIDGHISSSFHVDGYVQNLEFMSSSQIGTSEWYRAANAIYPVFGLEQNTHYRSGSTGLGWVTDIAGTFPDAATVIEFDNYSGLNRYIIDACTTGSNGAYFTGFSPESVAGNATSVPIIGENEENDYHSQYLNYWKAWGNAALGFIVSGSVVSNGAVSETVDNDPVNYPFFNMLMSHRNGPYGWPTFKQIRAGQTQAVRNILKKQNIYSIIDTYKAHPTPYSFPDNTDNNQIAETKDLTFKSYKEPAITSRHKPMRHQLAITNMNSDTGKIENSNIAMAYTHANNEDTFATPELKNKLNAFIEEEQMYDIIKDFYVGKDIDAPGNPVNKSLELTLIDTIYPRAEYTYLTKNRTRDLFDFEYWKSARVSTYDSVNKLTRLLLTPNAETTLVEKGRTDYSSFGGYTGSLETPIGDSVSIAISGSDIATTGSMGQIITVHTGAFNSSSMVPSEGIVGSMIANQSIWPLDARVEFSTGHCVIMKDADEVGTFLSSSASGGVDPYNFPVKTKISGGYSGLDGAGELQNDYTIFHNGDIDQFACDYSDFAGTAILSGTEGGTAGLRAGVLYNRRILETERETLTIFAAGDTKWQAAEQREQHLKVDGSEDYGPTWNSYEDFSEDLRLVGKDYTIVPEFRISEHMNFYIKENEGNFRTINGIDTGPEGYLTLTGSTLSSSAVRNFDDFSQDFFHVYNTSDFLKNFKQVKEDHEGKHKPDSLTFKCQALMKFLPYDGFFPATRTIQLASMFSQSYGDTILFSGSQPHLRTAVTPFFAPGIMFNTIKSGIAVDYPVMTGSYHIKGTNAAGFTHPTSASSDHQACIIARGSGSLAGEDDREAHYGYRVPFEAIIDPERYLDGIRIVDSEPHLEI